MNTSKSKPVDYRNKYNNIKPKKNNNNEMRKEVAMQAFHIVEDKYNDQKHAIKVLEDSLGVLRTMGVIDYESQAERLTEQLAIAIVQGKNGAVKELERRLDVLGKGGSAVILTHQ